MEAFLVVPLGTVPWEEIGFRGVLWGQIRTISSARTAAGIVAVAANST